VRVAFFGTSEFAVPALRALAESGTELVAAVTPREEPKGRGLTLQPSPVKAAALQLGVPVLEPENPNDPEFIRRLGELRPEVIVLAAYRFILKPELLAVPTRGCLNIHPSLLPRYRGAAPIQRAIMAGETRTGVSIFLMNEKLDQGDVILQEPVDIGVNETGGELTLRLAELGARLVIDGLRRFESGGYQRVPQTADPDSYAAKIGKEERRIDWRLSAGTLHNLIRALAPVPAAYTMLRGKRLEVLKSGVMPDLHGAPGEVTVSGRQVICAAGTGGIQLLQVKPEGSKLMSGSDLINGKRVASGDRLGE
jgi:methionyl-tRNA formyltransferase